MNELVFQRKEKKEEKYYSTVNQTCGINGSGESINKILEHFDHTTPTFTFHMLTK